MYTKMPLNISYALAIISNALFVSAHWTYSRLIVNGEVVGEPWQYIRRHNSSNAPLTNVNSSDFRCNAGSEPSETYTVRAGDSLGFGIDEHFGHSGIQQVYISKAPGDSKSADYDGSGDWARIYSLTTTPHNATKPARDPAGVKKQTEALTWATHNIQSFRFALPTATPPGEYLLRAEGLALHAAHKQGSAQFYVACAQIRIVGAYGT